MTQKKLPTGIQTFAKIREDDYYYVDKTKYFIDLVTQESAVFLSRPRRFGKSLTLSTLDELFSGNKALFDGLYAEKHWDWSQKHTVIRISFGGAVVKTREKLQLVINDILSGQERKFGITLSDKTAGGRLQELIQHCHQQSQNKVVILVDEYDKPMLDSFTGGDVMGVRDDLRDFYSAIKESDQYIRFAMLTGVSQFSKVNLFSGINHLTNITLESQYSAICGYTQTELETVFADRLHDVNMDLLRRWYNGYNWTGEAVYNPYDVLFYLRTKHFASHWYKTGSPTFLIDFLQSQNMPLLTLENNVNDITLAQFDIDNTSLMGLMFQTGYLTIDKVIPDLLGDSRYTLKYPNIEVQRSLNETLLSTYLSNTDNDQYRVKGDTYQHLLDRDFDALVVSLNALFASIPHDWYRNNRIAHYEGYWSSIFFTFFTSLGYRVIPEDTTSEGQIDLTLDFEGTLFLFEFKVIETIDRESGKVQQSKPTGSALKQLLEKNYADKYRADGKPIYQIGLEFSEAARKIMHSDVQEAKQ